MEQRPLKNQLAHFGRSLALLLNRTLMYQASHPFIKQSVSDALKLATHLLDSISPLVFILNRDQFYVDEEPLDPRINVGRIAGLFKNNNLQSISFETGLRESELSIFSELFASLPQASSAEVLKDTLNRRGVFNIKINHVVFKKVTEDDQVVSRDALKKVTPMMDSEDQQSRKRFMETVLESVLSEEFAKTLNISNMMANPKMFTQKMIEADLAAAEQFNAEQSEDRSGSADGEGPGVEPAEGDGIVPDGGVHGSGRGAGTGVQGAGSGPGTGTVVDLQSSEGLGTQDDPAHSPQPGAAEEAAEKQGAVHGPDGMGGAGLGRDGIGGGGGGGGSGGGLGAGTGVADGRPGGTPTGTGPAGSPGSGVGEPTGSGSAAGASPESARGPGHGPLLIHQLELMHEEVEKHLHGKGEIGLSDLAQAIFDMKKQLLEGIQAQKALGIAYANETAIVEAANKLTDKVMVELIKEEYQAGKVNTQRLAYIIRRLIPEAGELKRLLPQIKKALLSEGMPTAEYLNLIHELSNELQNEELIRVLQESSETIGVDGDMLIEEIKQNPSQAAELIYLASEIRKGGGDESALSDILVEYVDRLGNQMAKDATEAGEPDGEAHLKKVMTDVESTILKKLGSMNINADILSRMEERINERMESILDGMRVQWLHTQTGQGPMEKTRTLTVLQTLEHNIGEDEELAAILKVVRKKADSGEIEENNFSQINNEIVRQKQISAGAMDDKPMPEGILTSEDLMFILDKEVARAKRYGVPFSALGFAFVTAIPKMKSLEAMVTNETILNAALAKLSSTFRAVDYIGQIGKNKMLVLLPMSPENEAKMALSRVLKLLHATPLDVNGVAVQLRVAGVAAMYDVETTPDAKAFAKELSNKLADMVARVKSIQVLF